MKKEIDIGQDTILEIDPILEEGTMPTDIEGKMKIDMVDLIQKKYLIDIKENTDLTLETDTKGMTDMEKMINLSKRARSGVTSVNLWVIIH